MRSDSEQTYQAHSHAPLQIVAVGRNYSEHAKELNNAVPKEPILFLKPTTSYLPSGGNVEIPVGVLAHYEGTVREKCDFTCMLKNTSQWNLA